MPGRFTCPKAIRSTPNCLRWLPARGPVHRRWSADGRCPHAVVSDDPSASSGDTRRIPTFGQRSQEIGLGGCSDQGASSPSSNVTRSPDRRASRDQVSVTMRPMRPWIVCRAVGESAWAALARRAATASRSWSLARVVRLSCDAARSAPGHARSRRHGQTLEPGVHRTLAQHSHGTRPSA